MPLELVGAREPLPAEQPVADERSLSGVPSQMRLQMRRLPVELIAAGVMTDVHLFRLRFFRAVLLARAIRTLALDAAARFGISIRVVVDRSLRFGRFRGRKGHVGVLGPLVVVVGLVVVGDLLGPEAAGGDVGRRRRMLEPILISVIVVIVRRVLQGEVRDEAVGAVSGGRRRRRIERLVLVHSRTGSGQ